MSTWEIPGDVNSARDGVLSRQFALEEAQHILLDTRVIAHHPQLEGLQTEIRNLTEDALIRGLEIIEHDFLLSGVTPAQYDWSYWNAEFQEFQDDPSGLSEDSLAEEEEEVDSDGLNAYFSYYSQHCPGGIHPGVLTDRNAYTDCTYLSDCIPRAMEIHYRIAGEFRGKYMFTMRYPSFLPLLQVCEDSPECAITRLEQIAEYYDQDDSHDFLHRYLAMYLAAKIGSPQSAYRVQAIHGSADPYRDMISEYGSGDFDLEKAEVHAKALWRMVIARNPDLVP